MSRTQSFDFLATNLNVDRPAPFNLLPHCPQEISWPDKFERPCASVELDEIETLLSTAEPVISTIDHGVMPWDQCQTLGGVRVSAENTAVERQSPSDSNEECGISWGRVGLVTVIAALVCLAVWTRIEMDQTIAVLTSSIDELHQRPVSRNAAVIVDEPVDSILEKVAESPVVESTSDVIEVPYSFEGGAVSLSMSDFDGGGFQAVHSTSPWSTILFAPTNHRGVMPTITLHNVDLAKTPVPVTLDGIARSTVNFVSRDGEVLVASSPSRSIMSADLRTSLAMVSIPVVSTATPVTVSLTKKHQQSIGAALKWADSFAQAREMAVRESKLVFVLHIAKDFQSDGNTSREIKSFTEGALTDSTMGKYFSGNFACSCERIDHWSVQKALADSKLVPDVVGYFCTADGKVIHAVVGSASAEQLLQEAKWAVELFRQMKNQDLATQMQQVAAAHSKRLPQKSGWSSLLNRSAEQADNKHIHQLHRLLADQPMSALPIVYRAISEQILGRAVADDSVSILALQMGH